MDKVFTRNSRSPARLSKTKRAGITFPVTRVYRQLRRKKCANKTRMLSAVYTAVVLEYLVVEILEVAGIEAKQLKRKRIIPRHIMLGIKKDDELNRLLKDAVLSFCGVVPNVQAALLVKKK